MIPAATPLEKVEKIDSALERVGQYLISGDEFAPITKKDKELLDRWVFADELIRSNVGKLTRGEIANMIAKRYCIALSTAKSYMTSAESLMGSSFPLNKKHRIQIRIEILEKQSHLAALEKDFIAVAQLEKSIAKYLEIYPDITPNQSPKTIIYNIDQRQVTEQIIATEEADFIIEERLKSLPDANK